MIVLKHLHLILNIYFFYRNSNASKYHNILMESQPIISGSPKIYQLKPKIEEEETLKRVTLGQRNENEINKTVLLVGETGAGKSSLIDALVNYAMGVTWEDNIWFKIVKDRQGEGETSQSQSQTSDVIVYQIFGFEGRTLPFSLTIIDTPGFGDTRADEKDAMISERLLQWFRSDFGVHEINAVGLVLKASENRLTDRLRYVFDSVISLFGKNMENNLVALISHSDGGPPVNALKALEDAKIKISKNRDGIPNHFVFNNRQTSERSEEHAFFLKYAWDLTNSKIVQFAGFLTNTSPQKLNTTVSVMDERMKLDSCIWNLKERVEFIEGQENMIRQEQELQKHYEDKMKKNENYTEEVDEPYKDKQTIEGGRWGFLWLNYKGALSCQVCEETCHHKGCIYSTSPHDSRCVIFDGDNCTVCTKKCSRAVHVKDKWIYVTKTRKVKRTREDMKKKYESNQKEFKGKRSILENMEKKLNEKQEEKHRFLEECYQHVLTLERIAFNVNAFSTQDHLDYLVGKMTDPRYKEKVQQLRAMRSRVGKEVEGARQYHRQKANKRKLI